MTVWSAEIGSNHCGKLDRAIALVRKASEIGCQAVKFQHFRVETLFSPWALENDPGLLERKRWELPWEWLEPLSAEASRNHLELGLTVFSRDPADYGRATLWADYIKISSYQLLDHEQIAFAATAGVPLVMSVGMATEDEVCKAVDVAERNGTSKFTLLHCNSTYPASATEVNLRSMRWLRENFHGFKVGWSDHSHSAMVIQRAVHAYKADHVEFHLDLDGDGWEFMGGHCWLPDEIAPLISGKPDFTDDGFYAMDGKKTKKPSLSEEEERLWRADPSDGLRPLMEIRKQTGSVSMSSASGSNA